MSSLANSIEEALAHFHQELNSIRTGRATPSVVEEIPVECYGSRSPLQQVASISAPEPRLLVIQPWDPSIVKDIEKALMTSSLGITPVVDGKIIRLPFPSMTEDRRKAMTKQVQEKAEQTRVRIRAARETEMKQLKASEKDGAISEDALASSSKDVQERVDAAMSTIDEIVEKKIADIMTV